MTAPPTDALTMFMTAIVYLGVIGGWVLVCTWFFLSSWRRRTRFVIARTVIGVALFLIGTPVLLQVMERVFW